MTFILLCFDLLTQNLVMAYVLPLVFHKRSKDLLRQTSNIRNKAENLNINKFMTSNIFQEQIIYIILGARYFY